MQIKKIKKKARKTSMKRKHEGNERRNLWRWWWVVTPLGGSKISARSPLESLILFKIKPKGKGDNTHSSSHNICAE